MTENLAALIRVHDADLAGHAELFGPDPETRIRALADALASSPPWDRLRRGARMAVRPSVGLIGIVGSVRDRDRPLVRGVASQVRDLVARLRPVPWPEVVEACEDLAGMIRSELSADDLERCRIVPVPRGGLIVAGLLSYSLGVARARVGATDGGGPTIVVDDCALSGTRITRWLADQSAAEVVVATLHAVPELASAIEGRESRVRRWLVARPLTDHAARRPDHDAWKRAWMERFPSDPWIGEPDHVVYPWNEPDVRVWNEVAERGMAGWHVVPPSWCMKNLASARPSDVALCEDGPGPWRAADDVLWVSLERDLIAVARVGDPAVLALRGAAARWWEAVIASGDVDGAIGTGGAGEGSAPSDLGRVADDLLARGLLVR